MVDCGSIKMDKTDHDNPEIKENNIQNFYNSHQHLIAADLANLSCTQPHIVLKLDELFEFLEKHFDLYKEASNLKAVLPIIHLSIRLFARRDYLDHDIGMILLHFYEDHKEDENDLMIFVQILHQVLNSLDLCANKEIMFCRKVFIQLIKQLPELKRKSLVPNISACLHLFLKMYPDNKEIFEILWTELSQRLCTHVQPTRIEIEILQQFIDEFFDVIQNLSSDKTLVSTIQSLLKSNIREERKCGYYLFKKMVESFITSLRNMNNIFLPPEHTTQVEKMWIFYITILESLEENQFHLILPSLENLNELIESKQVPSDWLKILYHKILSHKNNLVLRWSIEFFMNKFTCTSLDKDTLRILLESLNSTVLYNYEGYFLEEKYFSTFLNGDLSNLYREMAEINWKSVPLCNLIFHISKCKEPESMTFEQILKIAARVRTMTDIWIREKAAEMLHAHLSKIIDKLSLEQYVTFIETLLTASDELDVFKVLFTKKLDVDEDKEISIFQKPFYEIALNNLEKTNLNDLISFLGHMPVKKHGWLSFLTFQFYHLRSPEDDELEKQKEWYGINLKSCDGGLGLERHNMFALKLFCNPTMDELEQCKIAITVVYINSLNSLNDLDEEMWTQILLVKLPAPALRKLCCCLDKTTKVLESWVISKLIDYCSHSRFIYAAHEKLSKYLQKNQLCEDHGKAIWEKCSNIVVNTDTNILKSFFRTDFFCDNVKKGESRIEECYRYNFIGNTYIRDKRLLAWYRQLYKFGENDYIFNLLNCHKDTSKNKPQYLANSHEHRLKMRIAGGIAIIMHKGGNISENLLDEFWNIVLKENNQPNITYFYEYLIAAKDNREDLMMQKLKEAHNFTSSQQISIMSIVYNYFMQKRNVVTVKKEEIVSNLLRLTMGANFHTRLFAQMVLYRLLKSEYFIPVQNGEQILYAIQTATKQKIYQHLSDFRLCLYDVGTSEMNTAWEIIKYVTKAPYDEIIDFTAFNTNRPKYQEHRDKFSKKLLTGPEEDSAEEVCNNQLQRKMNPSTDILEQNNLIIYPANENSAEMYVIASLIDKLPNLGGIARTCEILGIRNIVLHSKSDSEKNDFKNLSMTAEKSLNIIEVKQKNLKDFIINKRKEGFAVVAAEQTNDSENFVNFKFPTKCILLLGHEKYGIPPTLLGLLDHAVEVPQFGQVRSLNVHVTGALFMWEFCKQHLTQ